MDVKEMIGQWKGSKIQLALAVGVTVQALRYWELGLTYPNAENLEKLKKAVGGN